MDNTFGNQLFLNSNFNLEHLNRFNSSSTLQINKTISISLKKKNKTNLPQNQRAMTFCWDCKKFPITFICKYCRMDLENAYYSQNNNFIFRKFSKK